MEILKLREHSELASEAAAWFHSKWDIPVEEYAGSIQECLTGKSIVPQWCVAVGNRKIIGGIGVIENDFHNRKDLTPNVCAVYVEENYRCQGIAGRELQESCWNMFVRICVHLAWKPYISLQTTQASMNVMAGNFCAWYRGVANLT